VGRWDCVIPGRVRRHGGALLRLHKADQNNRGYATTAILGWFTHFLAPALHLSVDGKTSVLSVTISPG
jgi:hypothetical protein